MAVFLNSGRQAVIREAGVALLGHEARLLEQPEMTRDPGLRQAQDARELGHVQPLAAQHAQQAQARLVAEQLVEARGDLHINKSTSTDSMIATGVSAGSPPQSPNDGIPRHYHHD